MDLEQAINHYESGEFYQAKLIFEKNLEICNSSERPDLLLNAASCLASEGDLHGALDLMSEIPTDSESNELLYNRALCEYRLLHFNEALYNLDKILNNCNQDYPEFLNDKLQLDLTDTNAVLNLQDSCIVECVNLKSAIIYKLGDNQESCNELLDKVPIKYPDLVTSHNRAIYSGDDSIEQLLRLSDSFPASVSSAASRNLISLYLNNDLLSPLSDYYNSNKHHLDGLLTPEEKSFVEILANNEDSIEKTTRKLNKLLDCVREKIDAATENTVALRRIFRVIVVQQVRLLWEARQYALVERLLNRVKSTFDDAKLWDKLMAHDLFMQDTRFKECSQIYERFLPEADSDSYLDVDPFILGNLCVAYVLTGRNADAEALIKEVEADEASLLETLGQDTIGGGVKQYPCHMCIINCIIGTLYCVKNNLEFGMNRVLKAFEPMESKLSSSTWPLAKRCILSILDRHCKQAICIGDDLFDQVVAFLISCEKFGLETKCERTKIDRPSALSVSYEARYLRALILPIVHD